MVEKTIEVFMDDFSVLGNSFDSTFAFKRMPFGQCNAPSTFQRCMMAIFSDMVEKTIKLFMDDFSVLGNSFDNCLENLRSVLVR